MNIKDVKKILSDTAYVRVSGSAEERACAEYLVQKCAGLGLQARMEPFEVTVYEETGARLVVDGRELPCNCYCGCGNGTVKAALYYLADFSESCLKKCRDKIVLLDRAMSYKTYDKLVAHGAIGFITTCGKASDHERELDFKEIRFTTADGTYLPGVNIHMADAMELVRSEAKEAEITVACVARQGVSYNVVLDFDGDCDETVVVSAHYDSTNLSVGAYDNMTGAIGLLYLAEWLKNVKLHRSVRLLWCGSEERGLLGSFAYCRQHADALVRTALNINLDMLGSVLGGFTAFNCADEAMNDALERFLRRHRFGGVVKFDIRSSDSNSFIYHGVPAVSFARYFPSSSSPVHTRYDTAAFIGARRLLDDMRLIAKFTEYVANGDLPPRMIAEKVSAAVTAYFERRTIL